MKDLIILGAGDLGKDVVWLVDRINENKPTWNILGFTEKSDAKEFMGYPILGSDEVVSDYKDAYVVCALATPSIREKVIENLASDTKIATLIDQDALIHPSSIIEEGSLIFAHTLIGINAKVGKHSVVLYNSQVNHDVEVGDYCTIYPNASISGKTIVGKRCEIGTGSAIIQHVTICDDSKIGVGAAVFTNITNSGTTYGNPAVTMVSKKKE